MCLQKWGQYFWKWGQCSRPMRWLWLHDVRPAVYLLRWSLVGTGVKHRAAERTDSLHARKPKRTQKAISLSRSDQSYWNVDEPEELKLKAEKSCARPLGGGSWVLSFHKDSGLWGHAPSSSRGSPRHRAPPPHPPPHSTWPGHIWGWDA